MPAPVNLSVDGGIATITLASPPANALSTDLIAGLGSALDEIESARAKAVVVRSDVPGYFMAGADLKAVVGFDADGFSSYLVSLRAQFERIPALAAVSIAAVDGFAFGGGLELAMACTLRVGTPRSKLGLPEVKLGLLAGAGGTQRLPRLVGRGAALDLMLSGRSASGEEAARLGLIDKLVDDGTADAAAAEWAALFAAGPSEALAAIMRCADAARDLPLAEGMAVELDEIHGLFTTSDAMEGVAAFVEKRRATFAKE